MSDNADAPLVLITRPRDAAHRFAEEMRAAVGPVAVAIIPMLEIKPVVERVDLEGVSALIFTSAAGVEVFGTLTGDRDLPAWCVGDRTAEAAREIGLRATSAGGDAEALVALMAEARPEGRLLHLSGMHTRGDVAGRLFEAGLRAEARAIYDQVAAQPGSELVAALAHPGRVIVPLFSPRSAALFAEAAGTATAQAEIVALSRAVADALPDDMAQGARIADSPDAPAMIRAVAALISP
ncbi:uroporphyrinogen-III synthase [Roseicyclus amphidinii]|uniref:uroporphyrinogen-III synthase n=1 Tax=Roseicyclus amphidinii TaxID=3034232 RepID=UPI0024E12633|nr:uroporphyrinogen-III synthase [Roseicyclus sp. Amp-Y-6]